MFFIGTIAATTYIAHQCLNYRLTDPMRFGIARSRHLLLAAFVVAICGYVIVDNAIQRYRFLHVCTRIGDYRRKVIKSDFEIFLEALRTETIGDPIRLDRTQD